MSEEEVKMEEKVEEKEGEVGEEVRYPSIIPEDVEIREERIYVIPLWKAWVRKRGYRRAKKAINYLRRFVSRHMRNDDVVIDPSLNELIWENGIRNPPRRVKVKVLLGSDERVYVLPYNED